MPVHSQLGLWATPGADIKRGPSHDILEVFNPEGFSFKAPGRELDAREHRKRPIDASPIRRAIAPVPVLLFGVTTLRVMWDEAWARRKALKSRQRANFMNLEA